MISKEHFGLWKHEPITKLFFEFLRDKQAFLKAAALEQWVGGNQWPETVRGQIIELEEILQIEPAVIEEFYRKDDGAEREGTEG